MFTTLGNRYVAINSLNDKLAWARDMDRLMELRKTGSIGEVIDHFKAVGRLRIPESVKNSEVALSNSTPDEITQSRTLSEIKQLREVPYQQVVSLAKYLDDQTPFSTNHGVKGAQFENVLVVLGRGWNQYNWNQFLEWVPDHFPSNKIEFYNRNRNLFYVVCSRPKKRLALLFTQELSTVALSTLSQWFGADAIDTISL